MDLIRSLRITCFLFFLVFFFLYFCQAAYRGVFILTIRSWKRGIHGYPGIIRIATFETLLNAVSLCQNQINYTHRDQPVSPSNTVKSKSSQSENQVASDRFILSAALIGRWGHFPSAELSRWINLRPKIFGLLKGHTVPKNWKALSATTVFLSWELENRYYG